MKIIYTIIGIVAGTAFFAWQILDPHPNAWIAVAFFALVGGSVYAAAKD